MDASWRARASALGVAAGLLAASACAGPRLPAPPSANPPLPLPETATADWTYAVRVMTLADVTTARPYLERAIEFERTLHALHAAASDHVGAVRTLTTSEEQPPVADTWYLLGWTAERHADVAAARAAYRAYLDPAPTWSYLRATRLMRDHARAVVTPSA